MKKIIFICALFPGLTYASDVCVLATGGYGMGNTFYGPTNCSAGAVDSISVMGPLDAQGTNIKTVTVNGPLNAENATLGSVFVNGPVQAQNSSLGNMTVSGNITLNASTAGNIVLKGAPTFGTYKVMLDNGTTVNSITFEAGAGLVIESNGSSVTKAVTGGHVQVQ